MFKVQSNQGLRPKAKACALNLEPLNPHELENV